MPFRTLEISKASELHIKCGQLEIEQENQTVKVPIEDLYQIMTIGPNIRLSTMDLSILAKNNVVVITLDDRYLPTSISVPFSGHSRQSKIMHKQISFSTEDYQQIWIQIIGAKIANQAKTLSILENVGKDKVEKYAKKLTVKNVDSCEAGAARAYFQCYLGGVNRRENSPINSRLNYGYAVVRSAIARSVVAYGCHPVFGVHHNNQLNGFNLVDDLIEAYRPIVDLTASKGIENKEKLSKTERYNISNVLHRGCLVNDKKVKVLTAIDLTVESFVRIISKNSKEKLILPTTIPMELMGGIAE